MMPLQRELPTLVVPAHHLQTQTPSAPLGPLIPREPTDFDRLLQKSFTPKATHCKLERRSHLTGEECLMIVDLIEAGVYLGHEQDFIFENYDEIRYLASLYLGHQPDEFGSIPCPVCHNPHCRINPPTVYRLRP